MFEFKLGIKTKKVREIGQTMESYMVKMAETMGKHEIDNMFQAILNIGI